MPAKNKKTTNAKKDDAVYKAFNEILMTGRQQGNGVQKGVAALEEGKIISISRLPNGWLHFDRLKTIVINQDIAKICIVAVRQKDGYWVAYAGFPGTDDLTEKAKQPQEPFVMVPEFDLVWECQFIRNRNQVLMLGEKLPKQIALQIFPDWDPKSYKE